MEEVMAWSKPKWGPLHGGPPCYYVYDETGEIIANISQDKSAPKAKRWSAHCVIETWSNKHFSSREEAFAYVAGVDDGRFLQSDIEHMARLSREPCPACGHQFDPIVFPTDNNPRPRAGNVAMCHHCAHLMIYAGNGKVRQPTADELARLQDDQRITEMIQIKKDNPKEFPVLAAFARGMQ